MVLAFDGKGMWGFVNVYATNVTIFVVDNSSSSQADNLLSYERDFWY